MISATSSTQPSQAEPPRVPVASVPPLENGDRLTRREFERRYEAMRDQRKAELIEGTVYMPSPVHGTSHGEPHMAIMGVLFNYVAATPGTRAFDNSTLRLDEDNEPQPDGMLMAAPGRGGRTRLSSDDYLEGVPELVVEVASSSVSYDLHQKFHVYRRAGVQEYVVLQLLEGVVRWWQLREGTYVPMEPDAAGVFRSIVFPGLWVAAPPLLQGDMAGVAAVLQQGLQSPEHAAFIERLSLKQS